MSDEFDAETEETFRRYLASADARAAEAEHAVIRRGLKVSTDAEARPGGDTLEAVMRLLMKAAPTPRSRPSKHRQCGVQRVEFEPKDLGRNGRTFSFPNGYMVTRLELRPRPCFTVVGTIDDDREVWLTIGFEDERFILRTVSFNTPDQRQPSDVPRQSGRRITQSRRPRH